jgi:membrane-associated phospholipid phosphatase
VDTRWYLDVNRLARSTSWAHGFMTAYLGRLLAPVGAGLVVLAVLVIAGWWSARRQPERVAAVVWAAVAAFIALGLNQVLVPLLAQPRPYQLIRHIELLVPRSSGYAMPNSHAVIAGVVVCGLLLAHRWRLAALALLASLLLLFAGVYVGADYPSDVVAGAGFGVVVELVLWPLGAWLLVPVVEGMSESRFGRLVATRGYSKMPARQLPVQRPLTRLPNPRAMDALRAASEAARGATHGPGSGARKPLRTTVTRVEPPDKTAVSETSLGPDR